MNTTEGSRTRFRRRVGAMLPKKLVASLRDVYMRPFYRSISMVSRESGFVVWFRRRILRQRPALYHFEVHITDHCNLNCKGCAHFSNLCPPTFADLGEFTADMQHMAALFSSVEQIYLLGGEPLLHPQVADFVRVARATFPKTRIYLMTNGVLVTRMADDVWNALAETDTVLLCDSYPINLPVDEINRLGKEHGARVEWTEQREEFFKIPIDPEGGHDAGSSFKRCQGFNNCPIVRNGRLYPCAYIAFADVFGERFDIDTLEPGPQDSIDIGEGADPEKVMEFLRRPVPWCTHCDMDSREFYTWGRSKRDISEWVKTPSDC